MLAQLLELKYHAIADASAKLGDPKAICQLFIESQKHLYDQLAV
ncbi:hypothetical protein OAF74_03035 [bacterium]|nr:hypothetical protein [bacterium]